MDINSEEEKFYHEKGGAHFGGGILKKVKDANGKVTVDFQRSLKRLRKFNERPVNRHTKKNLKQAATLLLTPKRSMIKKPIKPKTLNETAENLLNETPSKNEQALRRGLGSCSVYRAYKKKLSKVVKSYDKLS